MQPKTEQFLNLLLWSAEMVMRPTFRNVTESYEGWAYRKGLIRQLATLNPRPREKLTEGSTLPTNGSGRLHALGGRDPEEQWRRNWDGQW